MANVKQIILASVFLIGGFYLIKKILPSSKTADIDVDKLSIEEAIALAKQKDFELSQKMIEALKRRGVLNQDGTENKNFMRMHYLNPDTMFSNLSEEQKQEIREASGVKPIDLSNMPQDLNWNFGNMQLFGSTMG